MGVAGLAAWRGNNDNNNSDNSNNNNTTTQQQQQVLLVLQLLALHFLAAYPDQGTDVSSLELLAGYTVVLIAVNAVYLSANAS